MKKSNNLLIVLLIALTSIYAFAQSTNNLLNAVEVANISGFYENVALVDKDISKGADGDLNFAKKNTSELILTVKAISREDFNNLKNDKNYVHTQIEGIGDEAYTAPKCSIQPNIIFFRKGNKGVILSTFLEPDTKQPIITISQMIGLAHVVTQKL